jgi:hypothetical protein
MQFVKVAARLKRVARKLAQADSDIDKFLSEKMPELLRR